MPYKSLAQQRWAHSAEGTKALGGPDKVAEWDVASKGKDLPDRKLPANHPLQKLKAKQRQP